ncbi:DNA-processing protein DprA [Mucilaginibacter ginsenosidivorax]|uniref:Smf/DprA SLOG domain-containing protein n=1 Tax=Mucilaginibacter ginsenosidivorax TaxID=862126 RepID=A0A5B8W2T3_9SPHI|nr:DNA-processing protein DprA [Mucilaginibacter ginsenosidivorax]QEC77819.1 hypothetical protein FSB76_18435 [Mucilaginibacter ginsenosidivorax]
MAIRTEDLVRILQLRGMGRKTAKKLCDLDFSGDTADLVDFILEVSSSKTLQRFPEYSKPDINEAFKKGDDILEKSDRGNIKITSFYDKKFPPALTNIIDPPLIINTKGNLDDLSNLIGVAVIGTREPSPAGIKAGEYFGKQLALQNFNVVSGLAKGCDASGHRGCLSVNGFTTAILAHGLHTIYPKENYALAEEILDKGGVLLSEYFVGTGALANYFVERDRLQAGLSEATIVIQTDEKGGTMHAVNATLVSRKSLAAIKYKGAELEYSKTKGNEKLIREGKAFALTSDNLIEFISLFNKSETANSLPAPALLTKQENSVELTESANSEIPAVEPEKHVISEAPTVEPEHPVTHEIPTVEPEHPETSEIPTVKPEQSVTSEMPTVEPEQPVTSNMPTVEPEKSLTSDVPTVKPLTSTAKEKPSKGQVAKERKESVKKKITNQPKLF